MGYILKHDVIDCKGWWVVGKGGRLDCKLWQGVFYKRQSEQ